MGLAVHDADFCRTDKSGNTRVGKGDDCKCTNEGDCEESRFLGSVAGCSLSPEQNENSHLKMCRYPCQSSLVLRICLQERTLRLTLRHSHHPSYQIRELSREIVEFIQENCYQTPAELYTRISSSDLPGSDRVDSAQVYAMGRGSSYWPRNLRKWARNFEVPGELPVSGLLGYSRTRSVLLDTDVQFSIQRYIRSCQWAVDPRKLQAFMKNEVKGDMEEEYAKRVSESEMPNGIAHYLQQVVPAIGETLPVPSRSTLRRYMTVVNMVTTRILYSIATMTRIQFTKPKPSKC